MSCNSYSPSKTQMQNVKMDSAASQNEILEVEQRRFVFKCLGPTCGEKASYCIAEFVATASLMLLTCMSCVEGLGVLAQPLQTYLGCGLSVLVVISIFGGISNCHINPAVTVAAVINRLISIPIAIIYITCQFAGALAGVGILRIVTPTNSYFKNNSTIGLCMTIPNEQITPAQSIFVEALMTGLLIWLACAIWDPRNSKWQDSVAIKFGFTISTMGIAAGPYTGASMNPARSLAPAIFAGSLTNQWIYVAGPLIGSICASLCYKHVFSHGALKITVHNQS